MRTRPAAGTSQFQKAFQETMSVTPRLAGLLIGLTLSISTLVAQDVTTYHNDNARTGRNPGEMTLTPANVNSSMFGKLFVLSADGKVDAEPLYLSAVTLGDGTTHNIVYVASEHDTVYAYDADTGALLWQVSMLKPGETTSDDRGCGQVTPEIGITATPAIDRLSGTHGTIYVVAMSKDSTGSYHQRLHALDITTGAEEFGGPVDVAASYPGKGDNTNGTDVIFDAKQYKERPGLLILNGQVYTSWSSHCDIRPYTAWIISYAEGALTQTSVLDITPNGSEGSVWQSGAGIASDLSGNIYFLTANGTFETTLNAQGFPTLGDYGNAFMKLSTNNNVLSVADYFNMSNTVAESNADEDLGSGGALVLPDMLDAGGVTRHLALGAGKDRNIYLVDRDNMGKFNSSADNIYQELVTPLAGTEYGMPAYFNGAIYYGSVGDNLKLFPFTSAKLATSPSSKTIITFPYPGTTPSISANGTSNAIAWAAENSNPAVLHAYDATNLATELYNSNQAGGRDQFGAGNKFITPMIAHGKVYVGTTTGVGVFGLLPTVGAAQLSPSSLTFGSQLVGTMSASQPLTLTNPGPGPLSISSIAASGDFGQTNNCGSSLPPGNCTINVTFKPTAMGVRNGTLTVTDNGSNSPQSASLSGTGIAPVAGLSPSSLSFGSLAVRTTSASKPVTLSNTGTAPLTITGAGISTSGDFAQSNNCGSSVGTNGSCTINVTFTPAASGARSGTLSVPDNAAGSPQTASLSGTGADFSIAASPSSRMVSAGQSTTYTLTVTPISGFTGPVALGCSGAPTGATCSVSPAAVTLNGSSASAATATVTTTGGSQKTPKGNYKLTFNGTAGTLAHAATANLKVR